MLVKTQIQVLQKRLCIV